MAENTALLFCDFVFEIALVAWHWPSLYSVTVIWLLTVEVAADIRLEHAPPVAQGCCTARGSQVYRGCSRRVTDWKSLLTKRAAGVHGCLGAVE